MKRYFNHFKSRLSLKFLLSLGGLVFILILIFTFGYTSYRVGRETLVNSFLESFTRDAHLAHTQIHDFLSHQHQALMAVENTPPIPAIFRAIQNGGIDPQSEDDLTTWRKRLEQIMIGSIVSDLDSSLQQLRLLDEKGMELVRVRIIDDQPSGVPFEELQDKGHRPYYQETINLNNDEYYVSPINLNREYGQIMQPIEPTLRVAIPLFVEGQIKGVLVSNINPQTIIRRLELHQELFENVFLVNQDGYFLIHPDQDKTFGFDRDLDYTLKDEHNELAIMLNSQNEFISKSSSLGEEPSHFIGYNKIYYNPADSSKYWAFIFDISSERLLGPINRLRSNFIFTAAIFLLVFAGISNLLINRFVTRPIQALSTATQKIAEGNYDLEVPSVGRLLEFNNLTRSYNDMIKEIHKSQKDLMESEVKFRTLFNMAGDAIVLIRLPEGKIIDINEAAIKLLGFSKQELREMNGFDIIAPEKVEETKQSWQQQILEKGNFILETMWVHKDGSGVPVAISGSPITIKGVDYIQMIARDMTERNKALQMLRESEETLRLAQAAGKIGWWKLDIPNNILKWSDETFNIFGIKPVSSLTYEIFLSLLHPDDQNKVNDAWNQALKGKPYNIEHRILINGETRWVLEQAQVEFDSSGQPEICIGTVQDITKSVEAQKEVERLANFPRLNPQPVLELDIKGNLTYINPAGEKLLNQYRTKSLDKILPHDFRRSVIQNFKSRKTTPSEAIVLGERTFLWSAYLLPDLGLVHLYANDITDLKKTEHELVKAKNRAEQADKVKTLFLANMSHEIRTPLNSILGFTELVEHETRDKLGKEQQSFFDMIRNNGQRLMNTVHEVLDISQIDAGIYQLKPKSLDLKQLLYNLISGFAPEAEAKKLSLNWTATPEAATVVADEQSLTQALSNLLNNAIKYTDEGKIDVSLKEKNDQFLIIIKDSGIGMSSEYLKHMYDVFSQESTGYTKKFQGIGLGLTLVKRFLDLNKVSIEVESKKGKGTTFTLYFEKAHDFSEVN
ncbi:MAG: PAS domain S-box protein [Fidelibacterota bacterium]